MITAYRVFAAKSKNAHWRDSRAFDDHEFLMALNDKSSGLKAFIGIHNTNLGPALGGTRMKIYKSETAAINDVLNLSKAMSYKCALANLPYGGGKGVIIEDPRADRKLTLSAYARLVDKLGGLFKTGTDVGVDDDDVAHMAKDTSHMLGIVPADRGDLSSSKAAARGVFYAMKAALQKTYGTSDFRDRQVAIKGVGKLGGELARLIHSAGGVVYISDIDPKKVQALQEQISAIRVIDNREIHKQFVDIFSPCALGGEFTNKKVAELRCRAIVGGANNQLATEKSGNLIHDRQILYAPDYIANAGGLIYVADELEPGGFDKQRMLDRIEAIEQTMLSIFEEAERQNSPTYQIADLLAQTRIKEKMQHG